MSTKASYNYTQKPQKNVNYSKRRKEKWTEIRKKNEREWKLWCNFRGIVNPRPPQQRSGYFFLTTNAIVCSIGYLLSKITSPRKYFILSMQAHHFFSLAFLATRCFLRSRSAEFYCVSVCVSGEHIKHATNLDPEFSLGSIFSNYTVSEIGCCRLFMRISNNCERGLGKNRASLSWSWKKRTKPPRSLSGYIYYIKLCRMFASYGNAKGKRGKGRRRLVKKGIL